MSTTDSREAFLEWKRDEGDIPNYIPDATIMASGYSDFELKAWQAALAWQAAKATGTAGEQETHNFEICMYFDNWLISKGFASTSRTEDVDGPMAPAMNWIDAVEAAIEAARQPAPVVAVKTWQERLKEGGWEDYTAMLAEIAELRAALAATAAPVEQPHYRMSEKPTAWLHTLPEGKFFNGAFSDNSQIIRDKDEADSECYFHGGTLTPLFTAEWTQAGLDYVNEKADELHKKIVGSQP